MDGDSHLMLIIGGNKDDCLLCYSVYSNVDQNHVSGAHVELETTDYTGSQSRHSTNIENKEGSIKTHLL